MDPASFSDSNPFSLKKVIFSQRLFEIVVCLGVDSYLYTDDPDMTSVLSLFHLDPKKRIKAPRASGPRKQPV